MTSSSGSGGRRENVTAGGERSGGARTPEDVEAYEKILRDHFRDSPFYRHMGLKVTGLGRGWASFEMATGRHNRNVDGTLHGGAITAIAESASGAALATLLDNDSERAITIELKVNFCSPASGGVLRARGHVVQKGRRIAICEVDVTGGDGGLVAKGISTYMVREREALTTS
jgi:acyl-CoA thioesterase